jgi:hypothetical protein
MALTWPNCNPQLVGLFDYVAGLTTHFELLDGDWYRDIRYVGCEIRIELDLVNTCTNFSILSPGLPR